MPSNLMRSALSVQEYEDEKPAKHKRGSRKDDLANAAATPLPKEPADEKDAGDDHEQAVHAAQKGGSSDMHAPSHDASHPVRKVLLSPCACTHGNPHVPLHTLS